MKKSAFYKSAISLMLAAALIAVPAFTKASVHNETIVLQTESEINKDEAVRIVFSNNGINAENEKTDGYTIEENELKIEKSGVYALSGSSSDACITVKKGVENVTLILDGLDLTSKNTAPIVCAKSSEVTIIAASGTVNTLTDTENNNDELHSENTEAENAVIKCKDGSNVTICGGGELIIIANGKNGIKGGAQTETEGDASLTIKELTLSIKTSVGDALKSDKLLKVLSGNIEIDAADDAVKSDYELNIGQKGQDGPNIDIEHCNEGIEAAEINIYSGNISIKADDDGINAANSDLSDYAFKCNIYGGKIILDCKNGDGIDSNGELNIEGGTIEVYSSSRNDNSPLDSEKNFTISGGTVFAVGSAGMAQTPNDTSLNYVSFGARGRGGMGGFPGNPPSGMPGGTSGQQGNPPSGMPGDNSASGISISAGDTITIVDSDENEVFSSSAVRDASYVFFASDELEENATYTLLINGSSAADTQAGKQAGMMGGMNPQGGRDRDKAGDGTQSTDERSDGEKTNADKSETTASNSNASKKIALVVIAASSVTALLLGIALIATRKKRKTIE